MVTDVEVLADSSLFLLSPAPRSALLPALLLTSSSPRGQAHPQMLGSGGSLSTDPHELPFVLSLQQ